MATVFAAYDVVLERVVAIKLLAHRNDDGGVVEQRFRREALAEAQIVHPNVVAIHDVGESDDGRPFIVMDFVEGRPLSQILADGPLPSELAAVLGAGIARALAAAHERGIVHRDVKPANILIDAQGLPHLTDFGLARAPGAQDTTLTLPGTLVGSAHYVAPEQARQGAATPQADLYALGAVLYHALAGEPPFGSQGANEIALPRVEEDPPDARIRNPEIDADLAALVHALMARDPAERPRDAGTIAERLTDIAARLRAQRTVGDLH
jgi:serine/threonine-protein kinase